MTDTTRDTPAPLASIDVGTNSVKCLVARVRDGRVVETLLDTAVTTRLGEGLGASGRLSSLALERTAQTAAHLAASARHLGAQRIRATGTSAVREASNAADLSNRITGLCGLEVQVLDGDEEARLAFLGAVGASVDCAAIIDVGGGSTEIAIGDGGRISWRRSFPVGAVRFTESHLHADPPEPRERISAVEAAFSLFETVPPLGAIPVVAVGGTARALALVALAGQESVEGFALYLPELHRQIDLYASSDILHRREIPGLEANRADIILAGAIILDAALSRAGVTQARCTLRGLRHGVVIEMGLLG